MDTDNPACACPSQRSTTPLTGRSVRPGAAMGGWLFGVELPHPLLRAGLSRLAYLNSVGDRITARVRFPGLLSDSWTPYPGTAARVQANVALAGSTFVATRATVQEPIAASTVGLPNPAMKQAMARGTVTG